MERQHLRGLEAGSDVTELPRRPDEQADLDHEDHRGARLHGDDQVAQASAAARGTGRAGAVAQFLRIRRRHA